MPGLRVQFPAQLFVTVPLQGALEMQTNKASELDLWFDFFFFKETALCSDIDSPAAGGQMILFFWLFGVGWIEDWKASGWGSLLNPLCHTVPLCQRRYRASIFPLSLSASHPPSIEFTLI